ncbi:MAG TPA: hypothetical protein EYP85_06730 [Armatimonadetes bacterium]|nr:hypothetical protein [Armatimonadota bacterium]
MSPSGKYIFGVVLAVVAIATIVGLVLEVVQWRAGRLLIERRQLLLRVLGGLLLLVTLAMLFVGVLLVEFRNPLQFAAYWGMCGLLAVVLMGLALYDWRELAKQQLEQERKLAKELGRLLRAQQEPRPPSPKPPSEEAN